MKMLLYIVIGLLILIGLYFSGLSVSSRKQPDLGMLNKQLRACPPSPNCVSSEQPDAGVFVEPLKVMTTADDAWRNAKKVITDNGGMVMNERKGYLHAQFVTSFMRYIDDIELRLDENQRVIHIRSASRVGHSDMGANRARVTKIRMAFLKNTEMSN